MWRFFLSAEVISGRLSRDSVPEIHYQPASPSATRAPLVIAATLILLILLNGWAESAALDAGRESTVIVPLTGLVVDARTGSPVAKATIQIVEEGFRQQADEQGHFAFPQLPPGTYRLQVSAVGFETTISDPVAINDFAPRQLVIRLTPKVYTLDDVLVMAQRAEPGPNVIRITRDIIRQSRVESVPELLSQVQGLYVQRGGPGGEARVRIRGGDASHVLILLDGQRINPSGTGVADLSTLPLEIVEEIEVHTGGASAEFGPDALAGAINIKTRSTAADPGRSGLVETGAGGWHSRTLRTSVSNPISLNRFENVFAYSRAVTDGDFPYQYSVDGVSGRPDTVLSGKRQNNDSKSANIFGSGSYSFTPRVEASYSVQVYEARRGLPGTLENPDSVGEATDQRILATVAWQVHRGRQTSFETMLGYSSFSEEFVNRNPATHVANRFDSKFLNRILTAKQSYAQRLGRRLDQRVVLEYRHDRLDHDDRLRPQFSMGQSDRRTWGLGWSVTHEARPDWSGIFDRLSTRLSARYDRADTRSERPATPVTPAGQSHVTAYVSPLLSLALGGTHGVAYELSASYGKSLRLPSLNALFWRGDSRSSGNPDLRPEKSEHSDVSLDLSTDLGPLSLKGSIGYFHSAVTDLVVWQPNFQGAWQPNNIGRALITGHEESLELVAFRRLITLRYQNAVTNALNQLPSHTVHGKRLPFYPRYLSTISVEVQYRALSVSSVTYMAGRTYTNAANTRSYDAYTVSDLRFGLERPIARYWEVGLRCAFNNVTNENYVLLAQYPMPGRSAEISLSIRYGLVGK